MYMLNHISFFLLLYSPFFFRMGLKLEYPQNIYSASFLLGQKYLTGVKVVSRAAGLSTVVEWISLIQQK